MDVNMEPGEGGLDPTNNSEQNLNGASPSGPVGMPVDSQSLKDGPPEPTVARGKKTKASTVPSVATGPRTMQGKERSKHNAIKHGIFSKVTLLKGESKAEFDSLLDGLRKHYEPKGTLEEVLVEKLATLFWRHRRLILAEGAEVQSKVEFLQWDQQNGRFDELEQIAREFRPSLILKIENPDVLERCLVLLSTLRALIAECGFDEEQDTKVLREIYGSAADRCYRGSLHEEYVGWSVAIPTRASDEEGRSEEFATPEESKQGFICAIDAEVSRLKLYRKQRAAFEASRAKLKALRQNVPDFPALDRLLRYEASLDRSFDRTLKQLERAQRMRLGLQLPPSIDVNVSSSSG